MSEPQHPRDTDADGSLVSKVRKLMDKAAATANPHEADAFSRKAAELVSRHRLDPSRLESAGDGELAVREIALGRGAYVRARLALLMAVAGAHDARVVFAATPTGTVAYVAGFTDDLDVVEVLYQSLHAQAAQQMASIRRSTAAATQRFRRSFLFGYADRMTQLLRDARATVEGQQVAGGTTAETAIALRAREERVEEFAQRSFGRVRTARAPGAAQAGGWLAGQTAAERADVGRPRLGGRRALGPPS